MAKLPKSVEDAAFNRSRLERERSLSGVDLTFRERLGALASGVWLLVFPLAVLALLAWLVLR